MPMRMRSAFSLAWRDISVSVGCRAKDSVRYLIGCISIARSCAVVISQSEKTSGSVEHRDTKREL